MVVGMMLAGGLATHFLRHRHRPSKDHYKSMATEQERQGEWTVTATTGANSSGIYRRGVQQRECRIC